MADLSKNSLSENRPRLRTLENNEGERHASWLELFFDLVFVLAVATIAKILAEHSDWAGIAKYIALFIPIWWTWIGFTFYADRFESEEKTYRILVFAGMFAVAVLALSLKDSFTQQGDFSFVICYVGVRLVLVVLYIRSAYYVPIARSMSLRYIAGFSIAIAFWLISLLVPPPYRYAFWAIAVVVELASPFFNVRNINTLPIDFGHIPERFGLFTIIVLGEVIVATATGVAGTVWNFAALMTAFTGFAMATAIWWINFDFVEDTAIRSDSLASRFVYLYGHFFIVASIVVIGIGVEHAVIEAGKGESHLHLPTLALLGGGIAFFLAAITAIKLASENCSLMYARLATVAVSLLFIFIGQFVPPLVAIAGFFLLLAIGVYLEDRFGEIAAADEEHLLPCRHADEMQIFEPRSTDGCEECIINNYKWVHLRLCTSCGHVGCCDSSKYKHATKHFHEDDHPIISSLEPGENWAWCYADEKFVPLMQTFENRNKENIE